jgi:predicted HAD superfamily phosphohydrolase YqeG
MVYIIRTTVLFYYAHSKYQRLKDVRSINYASLKQANIKAIGFDKDNCLTEPYISTIYKPFEVKWIFKTINGIGHSNRYVIVV